MIRYAWLGAFALIGALASCGNKEGTGPGTAERTGRAIDETARQAGEVVSDASITVLVKGALAADKDVNAIDVNVDTANGIVTLRGFVPTDAAKAEATRIALGVKGVKSVVNNIDVQPVEPPPR